MNAIKQTFVISLASLLLCGCSPPSKSVKTKNSTAASARELDALIAKQGSSTFRSFEGKWIGRDGDTDLVFLPNGACHMIEYGVGVSSYPGTYKIDSAGKVIVQLPTFGHPWPEMLLQKDASSLLLVPVQDGEDFVMGNRGGATFGGGQGTYWPFRPLNAADEARVRKRIGK